MIEWVRLIPKHYLTLTADFRRIYGLDLQQELRQGHLLTLIGLLDNLPPDAMFWYKAQDDLSLGNSSSTKKTEELELVRGPRMVPAGSIEKFAQGFMS